MVVASWPDTLIILLILEVLLRPYITPSHPDRKEVQSQGNFTFTLADLHCHRHWPIWRIVGCDRSSLSVRGPTLDVRI